MKSQNNQIVINTWQSIADCATAIGIFKLAIHSYESILSIDQLNSKAIYGLLESLKNDETSQLGGIVRSIEIITKLIEEYKIFDNDIILLRNLIECYLLINDPENAHRIIMRALYLTNNQDPQIWLLLGTCFFKLNKANDAIQALNECLTLVNASKKSEKEYLEIERNAHIELASIFASANDSQMVIKELEIALSLTPFEFNKTDEISNLSCALITATERMGDFEKALQITEKTEAELGFNVRLLIYHSYLLLLPTVPFYNPELAIFLLKKITNFVETTQDLNEEDFLPWYLLGHAYTLVDNPKDAYDAFQLSLSKAPSSPLPWLGVGSLYLTLDQLSDALSAYSHVIKLQTDPNSTIETTASATAWEGLACVYERCDDQIKDVSDALNRAAVCHQSSGDEEGFKRCDSISKKIIEMDHQKKNKDEKLVNIPITPNLLLRDLVALSPIDRINILKKKRISVSERSQTAASSPAQHLQQIHTPRQPYAPAQVAPASSNNNNNISNGNTPLPPQHLSQVQNSPAVHHQPIILGNTNSSNSSPIPNGANFATNRSPAQPYISPAQQHQQQPLQRLGPPPMTQGFSLQMIQPGMPPQSMGPMPIQMITNNPQNSMPPPMQPVILTGPGPVPQDYHLGNLPPPPPPQHYRIATEWRVQ